MADFGIGEAALAEGAKTAGEAAAAEGSLYAGSGALADTAGAGLTAEMLGSGVGAGLGAESLFSTLPELAAGSASDTLPAFADTAGLTSAEASALPQVGTGAAEITGTVDPSLVTEPPGTPGAPESIAPPSSSPPPATSEQLNAAINAAQTGAQTGTGIGQTILDSITKNPLTAAALGLNAASAISQRGQAGAAAGQLRDIAKPFSQEGESLLAQYRAGKLNPADEFNINKWEHEAIAQARGALGKQGGTALMSKIAAIQRQAEEMRAQSLKGLLSQGLQAQGMAVGPLSAAVTAQANQDHGFMQAQSGALQSLLMLQAMQSRGA